MSPSARPILLAAIVWLGAAPDADARGPAPLPRGVKIADVMQRELEGWQRLRRFRLEVRRITVGMRAALGELRRGRLARGDARRRLGKTRERLRFKRALLRRRVRALYFMVRQGSRRPLLDDSRAHVPRDGRRAMVAIVARDLREIRAVSGEVDRLSRLVDDLDRRRARGLTVYRDLERRRDAISAQISRAKQEIAALRYRRRRHRGHASEWNRRARGLERAIVATRLQIRRESLSFEQLRGRLTRPVPGMILTWFGEHRVRGTRSTEDSKGIEISALRKWKVRAPGPGTVRYAGAVPGHGNVVIVDHDEGYLSVIGYLGRLHCVVGQPLRKGRIIGEVRRMPGKRLSVYYELRKEGRSVDPIPWILGGLAEAKERGRGRWRQKRRLRRPKSRRSRRAVAVQD